MISLKVDDNLIEEFDKIHQKLGFSSRSEALRESILLFIKNHQEEMEVEGHKIANVVVYYPSQRQEIYNEFSQISMKYEHILKSITQYSLKKYIIRSMIVAGDGDEIDDFYNSLSRSKNFKTILQFITLPKE